MWWWRRPYYYSGSFGCLFELLVPIFVIGIVASVILSIAGSIVGSIVYFFQTYFIHIFLSLLIIFIATKICKTMYANKKKIYNRHYIYFSNFNFTITVCNIFCNRFYHKVLMEGEVHNAMPTL